MSSKAVKRNIEKCAEKIDCSKRFSWTAQKEAIYEINTDTKHIPT